MDWLTIGLIAVAVIAVLIALISFWVSCIIVAETDDDQK